MKTYLPTGQVVGDTYNILNDFTLGGEDYLVGTNVAWNGSGWDALGSHLPTAEEVSFDDTTLTLGATNVQEAITKVVTERTPSQIKDIGLDTPMATLENQTLREVFEGENSVLGVGKNLFDKGI